MQADSRASSRADARLFLPEPTAADALFRAHQQEIYRHTDRLFAYLMILQWVMGIVFAILTARIFTSIGLSDSTGGYIALIAQWFLIGWLVSALICKVAARNRQ